ncbi:hypothetical protein EJ04DRAFT_556217 [Polyplosphaeria fusca]|uniref:Peptidase S8/S53 domain-containing protein n=1 Tax=Polyplosphaeria fusca TaxID=682080 RepID=A0A9P4UYH9_9PLEO|nr:hypothetical protein EJ04DRAFT_556217 [Polyplosphaeria fusca]
MADKHMDNESVGDYDEYYSEEYDDYDDGGDTEDEVFAYSEVSEYVPQMDLIDGKEKHQEIIAAAAEQDLTDPDQKQLFLQQFRPYFKQKGTDSFSLLHSLAREMYDKSDGKGRHDYKRYIPLLQLLLEDLPELPKEEDSQRRTALHIVVEARQSEVAKYLCENVVCEPDWLDRKKKDGDTVIHIAVRENLDCVEQLVKKVAARGREFTDDTLSIQGEKGNTPLHIAVEYQRCYGKQTELVKLLLEASDSALGKENKDKLSPVRYHQDTQRLARTQASTPRITRTKPGTSPDRRGDKSPGGSVSNMALRPRKPPSDREVATKARLTPSSRQKPAAKRLSSSSDLPEQKTEPENARKRADPEVAKAITELLLHQCLRTRLRDDAIRILHGPVQRRQIDFDLVQTRNSAIEADDLEKFSSHLYFEPALQYVAIPQLELENFPESKWRSEAFWNSRGRKDYLAIFDWLYGKGVRHIFRVIVTDHEDVPHSDAVIIRCLNRFGVERLDWRRFDLSSAAIFKAVPHVTQLKLYCSGNDAILNSWSSNKGLVNLKHLTKIEVDMCLGLETLQATRDAAATFKTEMQQIWEDAWKKESRGSDAYSGRVKKLEVKCAVESAPRTRKTIASGDAEKKYDPQHELRELWMECMKAFANFIQNYEPANGPQPVIKIALIDDGVDSTYNELNLSIKEGQSYSIRDKELGLWNPYYHSANGHGTVMACLIRQMCPKAELYVAKLNEVATQGKVQITAASAVKAINWAREMGVNIISMSWSIDKITNTADARDLQKAIEDAIGAGILLFCASDDQGNSRPEDSETYPARINPLRIFRVGAATRSGMQAEWVRGVDYILPGERDQLIPFFGEQLSSHEPRTASSLATALASGLAALMLYCAMLDNKNNYEALRTQEKMNGAFKNLCKSHPGNQYLHVSEVFGEYLPKGSVGDVEETENRRAIEQVVAHLLRN